jgi:hypothetical protein
VLAALFIGFGVVFLLIFLTVLFWDSHRLLARPRHHRAAGAGVGRHPRCARLRARACLRQPGRDRPGPRNPAPQGMSPELVELALRKQRLQIRSAERAACHHAQAFAPVFRRRPVADSVRGRGTTRPSCPASPSSCSSPAPAALRWARRGWVGWQLSAGHATWFPEIHPTMTVDLDEIRRAREEADCLCVPRKWTRPWPPRLRHHRPAARQEPADLPS